MKILKKFTGYEYTKNIRPRDFSEIAQSVCCLYKNKKRLNNLSKELENDLDRELKLVANRSI